MAAHGTEKRAMGEGVFVRLPLPLSTAIKIEADNEGLSAAALLRRLAADCIPAADAADARPTPPATKRIEISADLAELGRLCRLTERTNGAIVQLCKAFREGGNNEHHADAESVLVQMRATAKTLARIAKSARAGG